MHACGLLHCHTCQPPEYRSWDSIPQKPGNWQKNREKLYEKFDGTSVITITYSRSLGFPGYRPLSECDFCSVLSKLNSSFTGASNAMFDGMRVISVTFVWPIKLEILESYNAKESGIEKVGRERCWNPGIFPGKPGWLEGMHSHRKQYRH